MSTFRILNQAPQYLLPNGQVNAGGSLTTYETDLSTPKITWADPDKATPNATTIALDAAGRTSVDVWGEDEYGIVMKDAAGVTIWTRNNVKPSGDVGQAIPALVAGEFLTNDGSNLSWEPILQVPDPTGTDGYVLYSDGANAYWGALPVTPDPLVTVGTGSVRIVTGGDDDWLMQTATASCPASGTNQATLAVTFPTPFKSGSVPFVAITPAPGSQPGGPVVPFLTAAPTATGFTAGFDVAEGNSVNQNITVAVAFQWKAEGLVAAA